MDHFAHTPVRRRLTAMLSSLFLVAGLLAFGAAPAQAADTAKITGKVVKDGTTTGIGGIYVTAYKYYADDDDWEPIDHADVVTSSSGAYTIGSLPAGTYRLGFDDFDNGTYASEYFSDASSVYEATDLKLSVGTTKAGVNASLAVGAHITGTVTRTGGTGISGVYVTVYQAVDEDGDTYWEPIDGPDVRTDDTGVYDAGTLAAGTYRVGFDDFDGNYLSQYWNNADNVEGANDVVVAAAGTAANIDATLADAGHITGKVTDSAGNPVSDIFVPVFSANDEDEDLTYAETDANGNYDVGGLKTGNYRIGFFDEREQTKYVSEFWDNKTEFDSADEIAVTAGAVTSGKNAELAVGGHIKGKVTGPGGKALADADVTAHVKNSQGDWDYLNDVYSDSYGNYDLGGLPDGDVRLTFDDESGNLLSEAWNNKPTVEEGNSIVIAGGNTVTGKNAQLAPGGHITGKITKTGGTAAPGVYVAAYQLVDYGNDSYWNYVTDTQADGSGNYDLKGLRDGVYRIGFSDDDNGVLVPEYYNNKTSVEQASDQIISGGNTLSSRNAELTRGGHISGKVTTGGGSISLAGIGVVAVHEETSGGQTTWAYDGGATTGADGTYNIGGLSSGNHRVVFYDENETYATQFWNHATSFGAANDISVTAPINHGGINADLANGATISGHVTLPAGIDDEGDDRSVVAVDIASGEPVGYGQADSSEGDAYSIGGLAAGSYRVEFARSDESGSSTVAAQFYNGKAESLGAAAADPVTLGDGEQKAGVDATLVTGGSIAATVVDADSQPAVDCAVTAFTDDGSLISRTSYTDDAGHVTVTGLSTGSYKLSVGDCAEGVTLYYAGAGSPMAGVAADASPIVVTLGATTTLAPELAYAPPHVTNTVLPTITGAATVGETLTAVNGTWDPADVSFRYQWLSNGVAIPGATASTYKLPVAQAGKKISVRVKGSKIGHVSLSVTSAQTAAVYRPNVSTTAKITVDTLGRSSINVACLKTCVGYLQVRLAAGSTSSADTSNVVKYSVAGGSYRKYSLTSVPTTASTTATVRLAQASPNAGKVQFNRLQIVRAAGNTLKTTAKITVDAFGRSTVNVSCTQACSGYAQVWSDGTATGPKSSVFHYKLAKAGYMPMPLTGLSYANSTAAKVRLAIVSPTPFPGASPQFNNLQLVKGPQNVVTTSASTNVSADGKASINLTCTMACSGVVQLFSNISGTVRSNIVGYSLPGAGSIPLSFTGVTYEDSTSWFAVVNATGPATSAGFTYNALQLIKN